MKFRLVTKASLIRMGVVVLLLALVTAWMTVMPGRSFRGNPPASPAETVLGGELRRHVEKLATGIGPRAAGFTPEKLKQAADYIAGELERCGFRVERQPFPCCGVQVENIIAELRGVRTPSEIVVVGAHYDSCAGNPAANDNGSGVAAVLALAREFAGKPQGRTLRFVAFVNEEPPFFYTEQMGSLVYARACRAKNEKITAMLSLETMGYFSDVPDSQSYPQPLNWLYPSTGNFIAFVGNCSSRGLVRNCVKTFRGNNARVASEGAALPGRIPGVGWSDHWAFWQCGYDAVMVTDTAPFRYQHYHMDTDTPDKLDYVRFARVTAGLSPVLKKLAE